MDVVLKMGTAIKIFGLKTLSVSKITILAIPTDIMFYKAY